MWIPSSIEDVEKHPRSTFLLATWHELFYGFTPDSFQPRLHNVSSIVEELVDMARRCKQQPKYQPQVEKITAELGALIREEDDLLAHLPGYRTRVQSLCEALRPDALIAQGRVVVSEQEAYCQGLKDLATQSVANLPKQKKATHRNIRRLATLALQAGKEDDDVWDPLDKDASRDASLILQDLVALSNAEAKSYECTLSVVGDTSIIHSIARKQGLAVVSADSLPDEYNSSIGASGDRVLHVQMGLTAESIRAAVAKARTQLELEMGLVSLYANPASLRLHGIALVRHDGKSHILVQSEQAFRRLYPRTKAKVEIDEAIELLKSHSVDRRVLSAIRQLALASASSDTRTKLVNLWASLETLAGVHEGQSTMERVSELIVPLVISRHVHRTTRYLAILTQKFGDSVSCHNFGAGFRHTDKRAIHLDDMLVTLSSPRGDQRIRDLLRFAEHPLLRFRIYTAWEKFHQPKFLLAKLQASKQRLEWQLARIYRARNLLVHEGEEVRFIDPLLDNLQNYLSMLVQRIIHELKGHPEWGLRELIEFWRGRMAHCFKNLHERPAVLTTRDFLEIGESTCLWAT